MIIRQSSLKNSKYLCSFISNRCLTSRVKYGPVLKFHLYTSKVKSGRILYYNSILSTFEFLKYSSGKSTSAGVIKSNVSLASGISFKLLMT